MYEPLASFLTSPNVSVSHVETEVELKYVDVDQRSVDPLRLGREQPSRCDRPLIRGVTGAYHKRFGALLQANWPGSH